jgi:hypothetical protein
VAPGFSGKATIAITGASLLKAGTRTPYDVASVVTLTGAAAAPSPDFDGNGKVDFPDFLLFAQNFGGSNARFDLSGNGTVDFPDFLTFAQKFGQSVR